MKLYKQFVLWFVSWSSQFLLQPLVKSTNTESSCWDASDDSAKQRFRDFEIYCCVNACLLAPAKLSTCSQLSQVTDSCCSAWQSKNQLQPVVIFKKSHFLKLKNCLIWRFDSCRYVLNLIDFGMQLHIELKHILT